MARQQRKKRTNKAAAKSSGMTFWIVLLVGIGLLLGWMFSGNPIAEYTGDTKPQVLSGDDLDYRETSSSVAQSIVDQWQSSGARVAVGDVVDKSAERSATGGRIYWNTREIDTSSVSDWQADMKGLSLDRGAVSILTDKRVSRDGQIADHYRVQLVDAPDGIELVMTVAEVYVKVGEDTTETASTGDADEPRTDRGKALPVVDVPKVKSTGAKLALLVDDCGADMESQRIYESLGRRFTFAVIPYLAYSADAATSGHQAGMDVILHLPMESFGGVGMEETAIKVAMRDSEIRHIVENAIAHVPYIIGVNNHQGSRATSDERVMHTVLSVLQSHGLFFVDSRTAASSVGFSVAKSLGMASTSNEIFIDNSSDESAIRAQIREAIRIAVRDGSCVAIGHCRPHTVQAVRDMIAEIDAAGVELVGVSEVLR